MKSCLVSTVSRIRQPTTRERAGNTKDAATQTFKIRCSCRRTSVTTNPVSHKGDHYTALNWTAEHGKRHGTCACGASLPSMRTRKVCMASRETCDLRLFEHLTTPRAAACTCWTKTFAVVVRGEQREGQIEGSAWEGRRRRGGEWI